MSKWAMDDHFSLLNDEQMSNWVGVEQRPELENGALEKETPFGNPSFSGSMLGGCRLEVVSNFGSTVFRESWGASLGGQWPMACWRHFWTPGWVLKDHFQAAKMYFQSGKKNEWQITFWIRWIIMCYCTPSKPNIDTKNDGFFKYGYLGYPC